MDMPNGKAPGTDGFTAVFFKRCWHIIAPDVMRAVKALECSNS
jgi:hypothetical protein